MSHRLVEISSDKWSILRDLYSPYKTYSMAYNLIHTLVRWHEHKVNEDIKIYSLDGDWQSDGTIVVLHNFKKHTHVFLITFSDDMKRLEAAINCLDTNRNFWFFYYPERLKALISKFNVSHDLSNRAITVYTNWYYAAHEDVDSYEWSLPVGITLGDVNIKYAAMVNELWLLDSIEYVEACIRNNPNVGAYDEQGNLIAWCMISPLGGITLLQVVEEHKRRGLGRLLVKYLTKKASEMGFSVMAPIEIGNSPSSGLFKSLGFKMIDAVFCVTHRSVS